MGTDTHTPGRRRTNQQTADFFSWRVVFFVFFSFLVDRCWVWLLLCVECWDRITYQWIAQETFVREEKVVTQTAVNTGRVVMMGTKGHGGSISEWQPFLIVYFQFVERRLCTHRTRFPPLSVCFSPGGRKLCTNHSPGIPLGTFGYCTLMFVLARHLPQESKMTYFVPVHTPVD